MSALGAIEARLQRSLFLSGVVEGTQQVAPKMRAVWISCPALVDAAYVPGQHVRVQVGALLGRDLVRGDTLRTYSIWTIDRAASRMALCIFDNPGQGPGARWASSVRVGDVVRFRRPEGKLVLARHAGLHLFCGDETASVPFAAIIRSLPDTARPVVLLESAGGIERGVLDAAGAGYELRSVIRGPAPTGSPDALVAGLRRTAEDGVLDGPVRTAYLAGEAKACKAIRAVLLNELGWRRSEIILKPFWTPGAKGLE